MFPTLAERLWARIERRGSQACWPWHGAKSRSGRREVLYPALREGRGGSPRRIWRVNRLLLVLQHGPVDVIVDDTEDFFVWLNMARRYYADLEASHICDNSECCNPGHLVWETHTENLQRQKDRERQRRQRAA